MLSGGVKLQNGPDSHVQPSAKPKRSRGGGGGGGGVRGHPTGEIILRSVLFLSYSSFFNIFNKYFSSNALAAMFLSFTGSLVPRHVCGGCAEGWEGVAWDPECISAGKNKHKMGIVFRHYQGSDDSILICSLGKDPCICFSTKLESTKCSPKVRIWTAVRHLGSPGIKNVACASDYNGGTSISSVAFALPISQSTWRA